MHCLWLSLSTFLHLPKVEFMIVMLFNYTKEWVKNVSNYTPNSRPPTFKFTLLDRSPAILTSDDFIRSNENVRTKWPIY